MEAQPIIADRAEFVDALRLLRRGHVLVKVSEAAGGCLLDGGRVFHSYDTLKRYGLIDEFDNPQGFRNASYYRLTPRGREFADRACSAWRRRPVWQRLAVRFTG
jgi:DNA-binding MarR family transcriptional regulator